MHENLTPIVASEKAEPLVGVIPLNLASRHEQDLTRREAVGYVTKGARPGYRVRRQIWWLLTPGDRSGSPPKLASDPAGPAIASARDSRRSLPGQPPFPAGTAAVRC